MQAVLLLFLFGDGARPDMPAPKPQIRKIVFDPPPAPPPTPPPARKKRQTAEEKRIEKILEQLQAQQGGLLGVLRADEPSANLVFGVGGGGMGGGGIGGTIGVAPKDDREAIRRVVQAHTGAVRYCYEKQLASRPDLAGRVVTRLTIDKTGAVTAASVTESTLGDAAVEACLLRQIRSWRFPARATTVVYPFRFENGG